MSMAKARYEKKDIPDAEHLRERAFLINSYNDRLVRVDDLQLGKFGGRLNTNGKDGLKGEEYEIILRGKRRVRLRYENLRIFEVNMSTEGKN